MLGMDFFSRLPRKLQAGLVRSAWCDFQDVATTRREGEATERDGGAERTVAGEVTVTRRTRIRGRTPPSGLHFSPRERVMSPRRLRKEFGVNLNLARLGTLVIRAVTESAAEHT